MEAYRNPKLDGVIALIVLAVLLLICHFGYGQVKVDRGFRFKDSSIVTLTPVKPLKFNIAGEDTSYVSILVDSISPSNKFYRMYIYSCKKDRVNNMVIKIGFSNGKTKEFRPCVINDIYNYAEYNLTEDDIYTMLVYRYDTFGFYTDKRMSVCVDTWTKPDFFMEFIRATN